MKKKFRLLFLTPFMILIMGVQTYTPDRVFQSIQKKGIVTIGISQHYPPLNFNGKQGLDLELGKAIAKMLNVKVTFKTLPITKYVSSIETRKVDMVIAGMSRNVSRAKKIWFSTAYLSVTPAMVVNKRFLPQQRMGDQFETDSIETIWDLKRLNSFTIAVKKGSSHLSLLKTQMPDMKLKIIKTNKEGLSLISSGKVNAFIHDSLYLEYVYNRDTKLRNTCTLLQGGKLVDKLCVGLPFGDIVLKNQIDLIISELIRTDQIDTWLNIYKKK